MFGMVIERVLLTDMAKVSGARDKKIVTVGTTRILCDSATMLQQPYRNLWPSLLQALIQMVELPPDENLLEADFVAHDEADDGYQAAFSQLTYAQPQQTDLLADVPDPLQALLAGLATFNKANAGEIGQLVAAMAPDHQGVLQGYCSKYGVQLV